MTLTWACLAAAALLVPAAPREARRLAALSAVGRLPAVGRRRPRARPPGPGRMRSRGGADGAGVRVVVAVVAGVTVSVGTAGGPALGIAAGAAAMAGARLVGDAASRRTRSRRRQDLLAALRLIIAELEAGSRPAQALSAAAAVCPDAEPAFAAAARAAAAGEDVGGALLTEPGADLTGVAHAWRVADVAGAPAADVLRRVCGDLAAARAQEREVAGVLAGARASAALLAGLPVLGVVLGVTMGADPAAFLLGSPVGRVVCCAGVLLDVAGLAWTRRLTRRAEVVAVS